MNFENVTKYSEVRCPLCGHVLLEASEFSLYSIKIYCRKCHKYVILQNKT